jgi:hypothetical protein
MVSSRVIIDVSVVRVPPLDRLERRNAVRDRFDARHRRRPRAERSQHEQQPDRLGGVDRRSWDRREATPGRVEETHGDQQVHGRHEQIGRPREQGSAFTDAAQVAGDQDDDRGDPEQELVARKRGDRRGHRRHPCRDRDRDGQDVVERQPGRRRQPETTPRFADATM